MKINELIKLLENFKEFHDNIDVYLTVYESGEELKYKVENCFLDLTKNDEFVVVIN